VCVSEFGYTGIIYIYNIFIINRFLYIINVGREARYRLKTLSVAVAIHVTVCYFVIVVLLSLLFCCNCCHCYAVIVVIIVFIVIIVVVCVQFLICRDQLTIFYVNLYLSSSM
jgi:hypothetical protein